MVMYYGSGRGRGRCSHTRSRGVGRCTGTIMISTSSSDLHNTTTKYFRYVPWVFSVLHVVIESFSRRLSSSSTSISLFHP